VLRKLALAAVLVAALALPRAIPSSYGIVLVNTALIFSVVVAGYNFIYGLAGVLSLAQAAFWGIGAYTSAILTVDLHLPVWAGMLGGVAVATACGVLLGLPTLKLRSHYLAVATIAFAEVVRLLLLNFERLTHGVYGIRGIPPVIFGPFALSNPYRFYYLNLAVVVLVTLLSHRFIRSRWGRALQATRDDELAAAACGVDVACGRILAFALSALLAGVGGVLYAHFASYISPEIFDLFADVRFLSMLLVGGAGTVAGPLVGAIFLTYLPEWLRFLQDYYMAIYGAGLVIILALAPRGIMGILSRLAQRRLPAGRAVAGVK